MGWRLAERRELLVQLYRLNRELRQYYSRVVWWNPSDSIRLLSSWSDTRPTECSVVPCNARAIIGAADEVPRGSDSWHRSGWRQGTTWKQATTNALPLRRGHHFHARCMRVVEPGAVTPLCGMLHATWVTSVCLWHITSTLTRELHITAAYDRLIGGVMERLGDVLDADEDSGIKNEIARKTTTTCCGFASAFGRYDTAFIRITHVPGAFFLNSTTFFHWNDSILQGFYQWKIVEGKTSVGRFTAGTSSRWICKTSRVRW